MRNDSSFPCMEDPSRCFIVSVPTNEQEKEYALSCTRKGELWASTNRGRWEQWCLIPVDATAGVYRLVNAAHKLVLECRLGSDDDETVVLEGVAHNKKKPAASDEGEEEEDLDENSVCWCVERNSHDAPDVMQLRSFGTNSYLACGMVDNNHQKPVIHSILPQLEIEQSTTTSNFTLLDENGDDEDDQPQEPSTPTTSHPSTTQWRLEFLTGELCYIQLAHFPEPGNEKLLLCDNFGKVKLSNVWGGWEVWRIVEAGNDRVRISSSSDDDETLWKIRKAPKHLEGVIITSVPYGRLLRSDGGSTVTTTGFMDGVATTWQLTAAHRQRYTISHVGYDRRLSLAFQTKDAIRRRSSTLLSNLMQPQPAASPTSSSSSLDEPQPLLKTTKHRRDCEVWLIEDMDHGFVALRHEKHRRCLQYDRAGGLGVSKEQDPQFWDRSCFWRIVPSPANAGAVCFVSATEPFLALSCNHNGELDAVEHHGPWESWALEPCMPHSLQGWQINLMIGGAVGAALVGPVLAAGLIGAEGAAAVAGAAAAAETTEAVGLGLAGAAAAMGTGAAVGLSATGLATVVTNAQRRRAEGTALIMGSEEQQLDRPFCDWKSW
ncbi:expressed unknown protein [Seminavis robusta]|uniref:Uncharacterized protein n=1 Tax=Seminavis robusta TaxID=568900 RepID=A0A9N8DEP6_9STRA|nr:expressed unknown protein [Seminavis robusta]|eukprot:Sro105_g053120.1 n/a (603) ;mRNA; f:22489-24463